MTGETDDVGFTGHKFDKDLGLSYMQARYYDPAIGRFYGNDPVGFLDHAQRGNLIHGFNRYAYANNNPYKYTDPDGELAILAAVPWAYAAIKSALFVGSAGAVAYGASEALNAYNESSSKGGHAKPVKVVEGVRVDDDGSGVVEIGVKTDSGEISIVGEPTVSDDGKTLTIGGEGGAHIEGPGGGSVGLSGVREAGRKVGEAYGAKEVKIQGGTRTTGANIGKEPRPITIKVDQ